MRKLASFIFFWLLIFASIIIGRSVFAQTAGQGYTGEHISDFQSEYTINSNGSVSVIETITYDFGWLEKHGIYRTIPFTKTNKQGKKFRLEFTNISVTDERGEPYSFSRSTQSDNIKLKIGDADRTITGVHTYVINYTVSGALTYFSDHDEFYWNVTGDQWTVPITKAEAIINLPQGAAGQGNFLCYTGSSGSTIQDCTISPADSTVIISANNKLPAGQGLTVVVGFPKGLVARLEPQPIIGFFDTLIGKLVGLLLVILGLFWYLIYPLWLPIRWYMYGRDPQSPGPVIASFDPPKTVAGRRLTPAECGALVDEKVDMRDISSMIVHLACEGYLKIKEKEKNKFIIIKVRETKDTLPHIAKVFLDKLFQDNPVLDLDEQERGDLYEAVEDIKSAIYNQLVKEKFFPKNPGSVRNFYKGVGAAALFTMNLPLLISVMIFGRIMPIKTLAGAIAANVAKSLRNFLTSQERQLAFQAKNQIFFEKLLPYAIAFGVEKIWAQRFKDIEIRPPDWYEGQNVSAFTAVYLTSSLHSSFNQLGTASSSPTTSSSGFSSGFSGGSSGGGGGGGGGGSW